MHILLVDDDSDSRAAVSWFLKDQGHNVVECDSGDEALAQIALGDFPMVLSDIRMPGMSGIQLLSAIKKLPDGWSTDVVLFTGYADVQSAIAALRAGVYDYLMKPVDAQEMATVVDRVAEHQALLRENKVLQERFQEKLSTVTEETRQELVQMKEMLTKSSLPGTVGVFSRTMRDIMELASKFHCDRSMPVLIGGETGTGKEIVAKTIHFGANYDESEVGPFVDINCAALAPTLFESELFGYEAGAFTGGAAKGQKGKLDIAEGGTLFLDEVGEIPLELQGKLLRVLQEKEFYRVGGLKRIKTDVRIICATNVSLEERVAQGSFRKDLYFRLKVGHIQLPSLRERPEDILPMANLFLQEFTRHKGKKFTNITPQAGQILLKYDWPGNVRELRNSIEFAVFLNDDSELKPQHLAFLESPSKRDDSTPCDSTGKQIMLSLPEGGYSLKNFTDDIIKKVLSAHDGNQTVTAKYLDISLRALAYRIKQMQLRSDKL